jgi:hypothetical protein
MQDRIMPDYNQGESPEDRTVNSFREDQIVFVDVVVLPPPQQGSAPIHEFRAGKYITGDGDVTCISFGKCLLMFRLVWNIKHFRNAMFTKGGPDAPDGPGVPDMERPALVIGMPEASDCPATLANPPFHDVIRDLTGQMVSVINDNPGGPGKNQFAYKLNVLATGRDGTQRLIRVDPRIINK